jgi:site-specific DNA-cytosine methylase
MFFESVRIFREMRDATGNTYPRIVVWENVPGALNSNHGEDFRAVLTALDDIGAVAQWWNVLDAQFFGVPQRRRRVFLVSVFDPAIVGRAGDGQILAVGEGRRRNPAKVKQQGQEIAGTLGGGSAFRSGSIGGYAEGIGTLRASGGDLGGGSETLIVPKIAPTLCSAGNNGGFRTEPGDHLIAFSHTQGLDSQASQTHTDVESERGRPCNHGS